MLNELTDPKPAATATTTRPLVEKWGHDALRPGFVVIPWVLLRRQQELGLQLLDLLVLQHLIASWWEANHAPFPSSQTIARRIGVSVRTVQRAIERLERGGFVRRVQGIGTRQSVVMKYDLSPLVTKLTDYVREEIKTARSSAG